MNPGWCVLPVYIPQVCRCKLPNIQGVFKMAKTRESIQKTVEESFLKEVRGVFGDNLLSVMAYGSYISGDFIPGVSDINLLVILEKPDTGQIRLLGKRTYSTMRRFRITPLIMTRAEFINSADVFPMEYMDIKEKNSVLFGKDETESLSIKKNNLRHELEEHLRGSINSIRQMVSASKGRTRVLAGALKNLFGSLKALFRGLLRLKEIADIPREGSELVKKVQDEFGIPGEAFQKLLQLRSGKKQDPVKLSEEVLSSLEELTRIVDTMNVK